MMVSRTDQSAFGRWWWTVDRWTILALGTLCGFGIILILAASPAVAERDRFDSLHFVRHQLALMPLTIALMFAISLQSPRMIRRLAMVGLIFGVLALAATLVIGIETKGARRWIGLAGLTLQPSEFVKPCFAIVCAWLFAEQKNPDSKIPGILVACGIYAVILGLLAKQPDLGQAAIISAIWFAEFYLAGLPIILVAGFALAGMGLVTGAYFVFPHFHTRVDGFFDAGGTPYQVKRSLEAFTNGGLWGVGPGEGTIKDYLPDAHADFVFAVAGEEFGLVICLVIVALFAFIVLRGFARLLNERNLYVVLAGTGLLVQFGLQAIINMASSLSMMPTKGMTLPFLSYGGSSLLALGLGMGMVLALTRRRFGTGELG
ncbi:MAG TPA: putative peptidoglycan glycosyltransferase FtsW [Aliidongia sp.]|nr:putative peptidoglycan glycosyltransferase FtsW [Aliidongia sp.]